MAGKPKTPTTQPKERGGKREKLSLYGVAIEDAIRAAARTGPPSPAAKTRPPKSKARKASK